VERIWLSWRPTALPLHVYAHNDTTQWPSTFKTRGAVEVGGAHGCSRPVWPARLPKYQLVFTPRAVPRITTIHAHGVMLSHSFVSLYFLPPFTPPHLLHYSSIDTVWTTWMRIRSLGCRLGGGGGAYICVGNGTNIL
jgi:hypothetical protein